MTSEQLDVAKGALPALLTSVVLLSITYYLETNQMSLIHLQLPVAIGFITLPLLYCIGKIASKRYFDEVVMAGSAYDAPGSVLTVDKALLQNTLEQTVLTFGVYTLLSYALPEMSLALLPVLVLLFYIGRILFIAGYRYGAGGRAFGFGLTFYPTVLTLVGSLIYLFFF